MLQVWCGMCDRLASNKVVEIATSEIARCAAFQVIYAKIGKWYKQRQQRWLFPVEGDGRSGRKVKSTLQTARNMMIVILFCWVPGTRKRFKGKKKGLSVVLNSCQMTVMCFLLLQLYSSFYCPKSHRRICFPSTPYR